MKIKFWGTRGSIPVPGKNTIEYGGNTTCLEITLESGQVIIVDSGTGIRPLGDQLTASRETVDIHLLITHIHWDHIWGFPFFDPIYNPETKIVIDGYTTCMKGLRATFDNKMGDGFFPIKFDDLKAQIQYSNSLSRGPLKIDSVVIDSIPLQHPQGGCGFRFREGKKTLIFITDNELTEEAWAGRHPQDYVDFCKDADILIHDAQYTPEERDQRKGWGHSDYVAAFNLAAQSNVKRLVLFHHDPTRKDLEVLSFKNRCEQLAQERKVNIIIDAAKEGNALTL